jgi:hypothetical protein
VPQALLRNNRLHFPYDFLGGFHTKVSLDKHAFEVFPGLRANFSGAQHRSQAAKGPLAGFRKSLTPAGKQGGHGFGLYHAGFVIYSFGLVNGPENAG